MAIPEKQMEQLFEQMDGPYRFRTAISLTAGSARHTIDSEIRSAADVSMDLDKIIIDAAWFNDEQKLVLDFADFEEVHPDVSGD